MRVVDVPALAKPVGYSHGVRATGEILAIAGQVGWDARGRIVGDGFVAQFAQALDNVLAVVRAAGGRAENVASLTIFVTRKQEYLDALKALGAEYRRLMGRHYPAMTLVEIAGLVEEGAKVEIQGLAVL